MDPYIFSDIEEIASNVEDIKKHFFGISAPCNVRESGFREYSHLEVDAEDSDLVTTITHFGTSIRFECRLALSADNGVYGRVICTLDHSIWGAPERELLGAFAVTANGVTDLPGNERGQPTRLPQDADRVVAYFLQKAHRANATIHVRKMDAAT